jgi:hypothetical protein
MLQVTFNSSTFNKSKSDLLKLPETFNTATSRKALKKKVKTDSCCALAQQESAQ